jgi:hypothetical protein
MRSTFAKCAVAGVAAFLAVGPASANEDKSITVTAEFSGVKPASGDMIVMFTGGDRSMMVGEGKKPTQGSAPLAAKLGASAEKVSNSFTLAPGKYQVVAFVKSGGERCKVSSKLVADPNCFPMKDDTICSGASVDTTVDKEVKISCGKPIR